MCKDSTIQGIVLKAAKASARRAWAVYEDEEGRHDLTTVILANPRKGKKGMVANSYIVHHNGTVTHEKRVSKFDARDERDVARVFGIDMRIMRVQYCR